MPPKMRSIGPTCGAMSSRPSCNGARGGSRRSRRRNRAWKRGKRPRIGSDAALDDGRKSRGRKPFTCEFGVAAHDAKITSPIPRAGS